MLTGNSRAADRLAAALAAYAVPGASMATVRGGEIEIAVAGVRNAQSRSPVGPGTIFDAASLSKPVFAYAVMQLIDAGTLSLDLPLASIIDAEADDPRMAAITVGMALSHTSGLPNWRNTERALKTYFSPGERFSYSGEGFMWLQRVVESVCRAPLDAVARQLVFEPLA